jgi:hypothetical protein
MAAQMPAVAQRLVGLSRRFPSATIEDMVEGHPRLLAIDDDALDAAVKAVQDLFLGATEQDTQDLLTSNSALLGRCSVLQWVKPTLVAERLLLQRFAPELYIGEVYVRWGDYDERPEPQRMVGRLLYLEELGLAHLVVIDKPSGRRERSGQHGATAENDEQGEPLLVSMSDVCELSDADFASLPAFSSPGCGAAVTAESLAAFIAGFEQQPTWQQLMSEAEQDSRRTALGILANIRENRAYAEATHAPS